MGRKVYYFDNAATTPMCPDAIDVMREMESYYGNPSSHYCIGREAKMKIEQARATIAECIGADNKNEIIFTSGGSESDNLVLNYFMQNNKLIYHSPFEHSAVLNKLKGYHNTITLNHINAESFLNSKHKNIGGAITYMLANNETGIRSPIEHIGESVGHDFFHTDAVQAMGHLKIDVNQMGVDYVSASAHKFNGPKGVGFLYVRGGENISPIINGGAQERGLRAGTENTAAICAMAAALKFNCDNLGEHFQKISAMRDHIEQRVLAEIHGSSINGAEYSRLPGHSSVTLPGIDNGTVQTMLDTYGICISVGSACHSDSVEPSYVLKAMGLTDEECFRTIRLSVGYQNTMEECDYLCDTLVRIVNQLRK